MCFLFVSPQFSQDLKKTDHIKFFQDLKRAELHIDIELHEAKFQLCLAHICISNME